MNLFKRLWQAIDKLAYGLDALADTVLGIANEVRGRAGILPVPMLGNDELPRAIEQSGSVARENGKLVTRKGK